MEAGAGGVQKQGGLVPHDGKLYLIQRPRLREGIQAIPAAQPGGNRLFHNGLAGRHRVEGGVEAVALYRKLALPGDKRLPGQGLCPLKEGVEVPGGEGPQGEQHPLPGADVQIQPGQVGLRPGTLHPAILRPHLRQAQTARLVGTDPLQTEEGGDGKLIF